MSRVGELRWWLRSTWFATLAGLGFRRRKATPMLLREGTPGYRAPDPPAWAGPPNAEIGVAVPIRGVMWAGDQTAVAVTDCIAYSTGFEVSIAVRGRSRVDFRSLGMGPPSEHNAVFNIRVRFADGSEGSTPRDVFHPAVKEYYEADREHRESPAPLGPIVMRSSGSASDKRADLRYWVWPLPPEGPMTITCEWPLGGVPFQPAEFDGAAIRRAGQSSEGLWR